MNIKISRGALRGTVQMISSKSDAHRLFIGAALADQPTEMVLNGSSEDLEATLQCLQALGADFLRQGDKIKVFPVEQKEELAVMDCRESGSTLRFLLPVAAALGRNVLVEGKGRLPQRPIGILTELLREHGCSVSSDQLPLEMSGQLKGGTFSLPGNVSSQFITGLLFALPLLEEDSEIVLTTEVESRGYIDMTLHTLKRFGIEVKEGKRGFSIPGGQKYHSPGVMQADGDWSNGAFWLTAGAMGQPVTCCGLQMDSPQGDKAILDILKQFGAHVEVEGDRVTVSHGKLKGCVIDAAQIPDLVPILCMAAAAAEGKTEIRNAGRLRIKESDRLTAMADCLKRLGVPVEEKQDGLVIHGGKLTEPQGEIRIDAYGDHRIVMSAAVGAALLGREAVIEGAEAVAKSYPAFFAEFIRLGGGADVL